MNNEDGEVRSTGIVPVLRHEAAGGSVPLDPLSEAIILEQNRSILLALVSSVGDRFLVPHDPTIASAMVLGGVTELLRRTSPAFPEPSDAGYIEVLWYQLKADMAECGHHLPPDMQDMLLWMFLPHRSCCVAGEHAPASHFMHVWVALFPPSTCGRELRQLPESVIERGDGCRDTLPQSVRIAIANLARTIRSRNDHLYAFLNRRHTLRATAG